MMCASLVGRILNFRPYVSFYLLQAHFLYMQLNFTLLLATPVWFLIARSMELAQAVKLE
jgi:hypothetical protein